MKTNKRIYPILIKPEDIFNLHWKLKDYKEITGSPELSGIYLLIDRETLKIEYIGQSRNIRYRLIPSNHPVFIRNKHFIYILEELDKDIRHYIERRCIEVLKPICNQRGGIIPKDVLSSRDMDFYYDKIFNKEMEA